MDASRRSRPTRAFLKLDPTLARRSSLRSRLRPSGGGVIPGIRRRAAFVDQRQAADRVARWLRREGGRGDHKAGRRRAVCATPMHRSSDDAKGKPVADPDLRDYEQVPFGPWTSTSTSSARCKPYLPEAWVDHTKTRIGYEIPLTRYFHRFEEPRPLEEIDAEIKALEGEILELLRDVTE